MPFANLLAYEPHLPLFGISMCTCLIPALELHRIHKEALQVASNLLHIDWRFVSFMTVRHCICPYIWPVAFLAQWTAIDITESSCTIRCQDPFSFAFPISLRTLLLLNWGVCWCARDHDEPDWGSLKLCGWWICRSLPVSSTIKVPC